MHTSGPMHSEHICAPLTAAQRMATGIPHRAVRLKGPFSELLHRIDRLGVVTILTGNDSAIQEKVGVYHHVACQCPTLLKCDQSSHPHIFHQQWKYGFAVSEADKAGRILRRLQFFNADGNGVHKIMLHDDSSIDAFQDIVSEFSAAEQSPVLDIFGPVPDSDSDSHLDINLLRATWSRIDKPEDFFARQLEFDRQRLQKLRLVGKVFAHQVANDSVRILLQKMADVSNSVIALIGNFGELQAYQGHIKQICSSDSWLNILNPDSRLLLREDHIDTVWVAKKPTTSGIITSLELFNRQGIGIARFFSKPESGKSEPREWRESIMRLLPVFGA